jgi:hypothetical protein
MDFPDPVIKIAIEPKSKVGVGCYCCLQSNAAVFAEVQG